jgi:hypothetical protein
LKHTLIYNHTIVDCDTQVHLSSDGPWENSEIRNASLSGYYPALDRMTLTP